MWSRFEYSICRCSVWAKHASPLLFAVFCILYSLPMPETLNLQIVTPEREVFKGAVDSVTLPGLEGRFGVLRGHAPLIAALAPGLVEVVDAQNARLAMAVGGGFFQVSDNSAMILADSAELSSEINVERARESESRARSRLAGTLDREMKIQRDRADAALKRAQNRLKIAG